MTTANTARSYGAVARTFHWLTAALILALLPLGLLAESLPYGTSGELAVKAQLFTLHKTLGVAAFFVALARILWAFTQSRPAPLHPARRLETWLAETIHWLLYGAIVLVPLTGWIHHAATEGFAPIWWPFGQSLPFIPKSESVAHLFGALHGLSAYALMAALVLHIAGALKHAVIDRDGTLARMVSGAAAGDSARAAHGRTPALTAALAFAAIVAAGLFAGQDERAEAAGTVELAAVASDWQVTEGALAITVRQFGSDVTGTFADWTAAISFDETPVEGRHGAVEVTIAIPSLSLGSVTDQAMGADFFNVAAHPTATFSADLLAGQDGTYLADGRLRLRGVEVPVRMPFTLQIDGDTAVMTAGTALDRRDFHIGDGQSDEASLGFSVAVEIDLTAVRGSDSVQEPKAQGDA